jgi:hypothetical protein
VGNALALSIMSTAMAMPHIVDGKALALLITLSG